ncbi:MAG: TPM domain-containing protein [Spirochaetes bacterium]|nr:TPM domain-containing protein [Spirochaetota bacterium]
MNSRHHSSLLFFLIIILLFLPLNLHSLEIPPLLKRVNDYAHMISPAMRIQLEEMLAKLEETDSTQIAILTVTDLQGVTIEEYSMEVAKKWKIGQKKLNNGVIFLVAKEERKMRIEVGYGLEGRLTDLLAGRILDKEVRPHFRAGNFDEGFLRGVESIIQVVRGEYRTSDAFRSHTLTHRGKPFDTKGIFIAVMWIVFIITVIVIGYRRLLLASLTSIVITPLLNLFIMPFELATIIASLIIGAILGFILGGIGHAFRTAPGSSHYNSTTIDSWNYSSSSASSSGSSWSGGGGGVRGGRRFKGLEKHNARGSHMNRKTTILTKEEQEIIISAVKGAEKNTSGEIVPMIVRSSSSYPTATMLSAFVFSFFSSSITTVSLLFFPHTKLPILNFFYNYHIEEFASFATFAILFLLFIPICAIIITKYPSIKKILLTKNEINEQVKETAYTAFKIHGLEKTKNRNAILLFVSIFEKKVILIADTGIAKCVSDHEWKRITDELAKKIKNGEMVRGLCDAIEEVGKILAKHFPQGPHDVDELQNIIVEN